MSFFLFQNTIQLTCWACINAHNPLSKAIVKVLVHASLHTNPFSHCIQVDDIQRLLFSLAVKLHDF